jgi:hypothetical protein
MNDVPPADRQVGEAATASRPLAGLSEFWNRISVFAKSTVAWMNCERPSVEPVPAS